MLRTVLMIVLFFCALGIVSLVLLQRGKGAEAGAGFGAGASGTVFGARGATTALSRATAILAGIFMVTCLLLSYSGQQKAATPSSALLDKLSQQSRTSAPASGATASAPAASDAAPTLAPATGASGNADSGGSAPK